MSQSSSDDLRPVVFAPPEESLVGTAAILTKKRDYLNYLMAGDNEDQAAERILTASHVVALWKRQDAHFKQVVEETLALFEHETLRKLEANVIEQALQPSVKAAHLALKVLEKRNREKWGSTQKVVVEGDVSHHLSELLDDPMAIDANYREIEKGEDDS